MQSHDLLGLIRDTTSFFLLVDFGWQLLVFLCCGRGKLFSLKVYSNDFHSEYDPESLFTILQ